MSMELDWDLCCLSCSHDAECSEIGGRQEGRGYGAACVPGLTEPPHYERRQGQGAPDPDLTPSYHGRDCLGNGSHTDIECCCDECDYLMVCYPPDHQEN